MKIIKLIFNAYIALLKYKLSNQDKNTENDKDIWLIGGHGGELFDDNSKVIYEYIKKMKKI